MVRRESGGLEGIRWFGGNPVVRRESGGSEGVRWFGGNPVVRRESGGSEGLSFPSLYKLMIDRNNNNNDVTFF